MIRACLFYDPKLTEYASYFWANPAVLRPERQQLGFAELAHRLHSAEEYQLLIIIPEQLVGSRQIELPHISTKKARQALGFALEEDIACPLDDVHWAFERNTQGYMVRVVDKAVMLGLNNTLVEFELQAQQILCPSMALPENGMFLLPDTLICTHQDCTGALPYAQAQLVVNLPLTRYAFQDSQNTKVLSNTAQEQQTAEVSELDFQSWFIAQLPAHVGEANLLQGEFEPKIQKLALRFWQILCLALVTLCVLSALGLSAAAYLHNRAELQKLNDQIAADYKHFFPGATQVISPKFRVEQLLKSHSAGSNALFWLYFRAISHSNTPAIALQHVHFQNQKARLKITAPNFTALKNYSQKLQQDGLKVKQLKANTEAKQVVAELELFR